MECQKVHQLVSEYIDGSLSEKDCTEFKEHIINCNQCRQLIQETKAAIAFLNENQDIQVPANFRDNLMKKITPNREEKASVGQKVKSILFGRKIVWAASLTAIASMLLLFFVGINYSKEFHSIGFIPPTASEEKQSVAIEGKSKASDSSKGGSSGPVWTDKSEGQSKDQLSTQQLVRSPSGTADTYNSYDTQKSPVRKIIRNENINIEVEDYTKTEGTLLSSINKYQGYIENSNMNTNGEKRGFYVIRVPEDKLNALTNEVTKLGKVVNLQINGQDITEEFRDNEARLKALQKQEERITALLTKAQNLQDVIALEKEMERLRQEIEVLQGKQKSLDQQSNMATLRVDILEVKVRSKIETGGWRGLLNQSGNALVGSINFILYSIKGLFVLFSGALPFLVILTVIVLLGRYWYKKKK